jgi:heme exporter protein C
MHTGERLVPAMTIVAGLMLAASPFIIDRAPYESTMGLVQRIFYYHFPIAMTMMLAAIVCGVASAVYLFRRREGADHLAVAAAEMAAVFGLLVLITGPLWARKSWGVWWVWDARITSTFIMWMVFNSYLLLRRFGGAGSETLAAAVGFFGMMLVPFIYWSVNLWRTLHPSTSVVPTLPVSMGVPLYFCWVAFTLLFAVLIILRVRLERNRVLLERAYLAAEE